MLLAYSGEPGEPYESIRRAGFDTTFGERDPAVGSIAGPVFGVNHTLSGAVAITAPIARFTPAVAAKCVLFLVKATSRLTSELGGHMRTIYRPR